MRKYLTKKMIDKSTKNSSIRGVSLTEIMFATALTGVVISAAGYGVSSLVGSSNAASARSDRRAELNRSLDFMASEIRESTGIEKNALTAATPSDFTALGSGATKVLMVKTSDTGTTPIIYYTAAPTTGAWKGPRVVYRWGPAFDNRGNYTNASTPNTWTHEVLIDKISAADAATQIIGGIPGAGRNCTSTAASPNNGGTYNGDSGFNACVDAAGRTAVIRQDGQIAKVLGASENYVASTNTGSRKINAAGPTPSSLPSGAVSATLPPDCFTKNDANGLVTATCNKTITVTALKSGYYKPTSVRVAVGTNISNFTNNSFFTTGSNNTNLISMPANNPSSQSITLNVTSGQMLSIAGCSNSTGNMSSGFNTSNISYCPKSTVHQGTTVFTFKQGDPVPNIAGAYADGVQQPSLRELITGSQTIANVPAYNATTGRGLKSNELYYVYELYTTSASSTYRDLQDIIVKVTF
jgi:hypothetical protein